MKDFAQLLDVLYFTNSNRAKEDILAAYLQRTPDPDRGWALAALAGTLRFDLFKRGLIKTLVTDRLDPELFALSYDYVGELSETVALAWPPAEEPSLQEPLPALHQVIEDFQRLGKTEMRPYLAGLLDRMTPPQRWALLKLGTRSLRVGMSARSVKRTLARLKGVDLERIEELWHGLEPPYEDLFAWIDGRAGKPDTSDALTFTPVMLAHPLDEEGDLDLITPDTHLVEWKWDGIRIQIAADGNDAKVFTRTGDDISHSFPDITAMSTFDAVIDGELVVHRNGQVAPFNELQQRLNKKKPSARLVETLPARVIVYDILKNGETDFRTLPLSARRQHLESFMACCSPDRFMLSQLLGFDTVEDLRGMRQRVEGADSVVEGVMIKQASSPYVSGRPKHRWYKWKRDPLVLDAVLMYAQRGHGKRSSYYSDYTFGLWGREGELLPIGKAYFGFTDEELKQLDRWIRTHKTNRFGPVQEVEKELVLEVAFDGAQRSRRHKSGFALRFPRISRIRWDKPANEADRIESLASMVSG